MFSTPLRVSDVGVSTQLVVASGPGADWIGRVIRVRAWVFGQLRPGGRSRGFKQIVEKR